MNNMLLHKSVRCQLLLVTLSLASVVTTHASAAERERGSRNDVDRAGLIEESAANDADEVVITRARRNQRGERNQNNRRGRDGNNGNDGDNNNNNNVTERLRGIIAELGLTGDPAVGRNIPAIDSPIPQLGKALFFSKILGGETDSACVTCHHPSLGGGDDLSLSIGVGADSPDLLGPGRTIDGSAVPNVPRNAPTTFNIAMWDRGLFHDSRVQALNPDPQMNGMTSEINTPDANRNQPDNRLQVTDSLSNALSRFPVTSVEEMRGDFLAAQDNDALREGLTQRLNNDPAWLLAFQTAYGNSSMVITFDDVAFAVSEYMRSQDFTNNPWKSFVQGDDAAISAEAQAGAVLFFTAANQGGGDCSSCHSGDFFTDESFHNIANPQIGLGKGDGPTNDDDFGRERVSNRRNDRWAFRTPSLLNVAVTGPYTHAGAYQTLDQVVSHYNNPRASVNDFFANAEWCDNEQFANEPGCESLFPNGPANTNRALRNDDVPNNINLNGNERAQIVAFLETLTDPCVVDRDCLAPWIPEQNENIDNLQIDAIDATGGLL